MSDSKISSLSSGSPAQTTDLVPAARGGNTVRLSAQDLSSTLLVGTAGGMTPSPLYSPSEAPNTINPVIYGQDKNGDWHAYAGIDITTTDAAGSGPTPPDGTLTFFKRMFFRDTGATTQVGKNAFLSINHDAGVGTAVTNQDRGLWVYMKNPTNDTATRYGMEAVQIQMDINGTPTWQVPAVDGEGSALSVQLEDNHVGSLTGPNIGTNAIRAQYFRRGGSWGSVHPAAIRCLMTSASNVDSGGEILSGLYAQVDDANANSVNVSGVAVNVIAPAHRLANSNTGVQVANFGTNTNDWNIKSLSSDGAPTNGRNWFGGNTYVPNILTAAGKIGVTGSLGVTGSVETSQLATPGQPSVTAVGTTGATTYGYKIIAKDGKGGRTPASTERTVSNGNATLDNTNYNQIQFNPVAGAASYEVYRTTAGGSPNTLGVIATVTPTSTMGQTSFIVQDKGLAGDSSSAQTVNTTGQLAVIERIKPGTFTAAQLAALPDPVAGQMAYASDGGSGGTPAIMAYLNGTWKALATQ